jgi:putative transposase
LNNPERATLTEIGKRLGRKMPAEVACVAKPDDDSGLYWELVANKFDGSQHRQYSGRPTVPLEVEALVVRMTRENTGGYDRIIGAIANLDHHLSDQTVGNILSPLRDCPAAQRSRTTSWKDFISAHKCVLAGADFFTAEVLTLRGQPFMRAESDDSS